MLQLCSATQRAALCGSLRDGGRAKDLVEPYVPLRPPRALEKPPVIRTLGRRRPATTTGSCRVMGHVNPGLLNPKRLLNLGGIPFKYHIVTIWRVPPQLINHGSLIRSWHYHRYEWLDYWHNDGDLGIHHFRNVFVEVCVIRAEELLTGCTSKRIGASGNLISGDFTTQNISIISGTLR